MCHTTDSTPPRFGTDLAAFTSGADTLTSADGTRFSVLTAQPENADDNAPAIIILPDVRGTHAYYAELASRFAARGMPSIVVDYYGRTAGPGERDESFPWREHFPQVTTEGVQTDVAAAYDHLRETGTRGPVFIVGFCFGGGQSWAMAGSDLDLAGSIGFYGLPRFADPIVDQLRAPLLLLLAGEDVATSTEDFAAFTAKLDAAGHEYEVQTYEGAPHSFFDASYEQWQDACADAWQRTLAFIEQHAAPVPA